MKKQGMLRVAAALAMSAAVAGGLVFVGNHAEEPSLTYNQLLVLAGDENAASAALNELEAGSGLASSSVIKVEEALANIFAAEYGMGTPDSDQNAPADADSAASDSETGRRSGLRAGSRHRGDQRFQSRGRFCSSLQRGQLLP